MFNFIDYRNATYQGPTQDGKPHGLGILIDSQLMFLLAEFRQGEIDGPVFIVYADCKIFCGRIRNKMLSGLCCFYIKDKMQIYMNYSQSRGNNKNLIAVLPFCKVILQVDNSQQQHPKVKKYENYGGKGGDMNQILERLFGKYYGLDEYSSWQTFLIINFIEPHQKKLYWRPSSQEKYRQFFLCKKNGGLGIKILVFHDEQFANKIQGSPFIVSAVGKFNKQQVLSGYGQRLIDYQFFAKVEEGIFHENEKQTFQYLRKNRTMEARNFFIKQQLKSVDFENYFYNLSYLYNLEKIYSKLNVSLVEETHKIALVTINRPNQSPIQLAEIDRRQRKRSQARPITKYSPHIKSQAIGHQRSSVHKEQSTYLQNDGKPLFLENKSIDKLNQSGSMSEAKKSIKGSVQKIKKINPQTRIKAIKKYQQMFMANKKGELSDSLQKKSLIKNQEVKYEKPLKPKLQSTYKQIDVSTRNLQQTYKYKPKYDYQKKNQLDQFITGRKKNVFTPTKYQAFQQRKQDLRLRPHRDDSFYSTKLPKDNQQFFTFTRSNTDIHTPQKNLPLIKEITPQKRIVQKHSFSRENQPYYKNILEDDVYSKYSNRITQKQQQLKYFNKVFQIQNNNDSPPKIKRQANHTNFIRQEPPLMGRQNDKSVSPLPLKNKTPGKIKVTSKRKDEDYLY